MAALLSVALPGLGHLYLGRRLLGLLELMAGLGLFLAALVHLTITFARVLAGEAPPLDLLRICLPWGAALVGYSLAVGLFTRIVSRRRVVATKGRR